MEVSGQFHASAALLEKSSRCRFVRRLAGLHDVARKEFPVPAGDVISTIQPVSIKIYRVNADGVTT
jgi:hypothetical protein